MNLRPLIKNTVVLFEWFQSLCLGSPIDVGKRPAVRDDVKLVAVVNQPLPFTHVVGLGNCNREIVHLGVVTFFTQAYTCVLIPAFDSRGLLPEGIHDATWLEVEQRFGFTPRRELLLQGLYRGLLSLKMAGCKTAFLDGSLVTQKPYPADFDVCWDGGQS